MATARLTKDQAIRAYVLALFIVGIGHLVLGYQKRGIIIIFVGIIVGLIAIAAANFLVIVVLGMTLWLWQLFDLYEIIQRSKKVYE